MIDRALTGRIKEILGSKYTGQILDYMEVKGIVNNKNENYTRGYITHIVNGVKSNPLIEKAIIELCESRLKEYQNVSISKNRILKSI